MSNELYVMSVGFTKKPDKMGWDVESVECPVCKALSDRHVSGCAHFYAYVQIGDRGLMYFLKPK